MSKREFLEILKDYLDKYFSKDEVSDILRDYEEYFIDGEIEGKTDIQIIESLGSPKAIVRNLVDEMKAGREDNTNKKLDKVYDFLNKVKLRLKDGFIKVKDIINDKLTPSLKGDDKGLSTSIIRVLLTCLSLGLLGIWILFIIFMGCIGLTFLFLNVAFIVMLGTSGPLFILDKSIAFLIVFSTISVIGFDILFLQIYFYILGLSKKSLKSYKNWLKNKMKYINANKKNKGDDIDE